MGLEPKDDAREAPEGCSDRLASGPDAHCAAGAAIAALDMGKRRE